MAATGTVVLVPVNLAPALRTPRHIFVFDDLHVIRGDFGIEIPFHPLPHLGVELHQTGALPAGNQILPAIFYNRNEEKA